MTAALTTAMARELRQVLRPRWQRRALAWAPIVAAAVVSGLHVSADDARLCSATTPCDPSYYGSLTAGLLFAAAFAAFWSGRTALWLGVVFAVADIGGAVAGSAVDPGSIGILGADVAFVATCGWLAGLSRNRTPPESVRAWLDGLPRAPVPGGYRPRLGRVTRIGSAVVLVLALVLGLWSWREQTRAEQRQREADRITAEVVRQLDPVTIAALLPDGRTVEVDVLDVDDHPVGQRLEFYVDGQGLLEPVSDPYDATGWITIAVILAGLGLAWLQRARYRMHGLSQLLAEPAPTMLVYVRLGTGVAAVYPADAEPGAPAIGEVPLRFATTSTMEDLPPTGPALLHGVPIAEHWCALTVENRTLLPRRPFVARPLAPPFTEAPTPLPLAPPAPVPLPEPDLDRNPEQIHTHRQHPLLGYGVVLGLPLILVGPLRILSFLPDGAAAAIAVAAVVGSAAIGWRLFLRPRIAWNAGGFALVSGTAVQRVPWPGVTAIAAGSRLVVIDTTAGRYGVPAGGGPALLPHRSPEQLAQALRQARANAAADTGPPDLRRPAPPLLLVALTLAYAPALATLILTLR